MDDSEGFGAAMAATMARVSDVVAILSPEGIVEELNAAGLALLGYETSDELRGRSLVELVHPDDLGGVLTSFARVMGPEIVEGPPPLLRVQRADGTYVRLEANGTAAFDADGAVERVVVVARPTVEADLHEQLMALLTAGAPSERCFELVPAFGAWRQPNFASAAFARDDDGKPGAFGDPAVTALGGIDDEDAPWGLVAPGEDRILVVEELAGPVRDRARALGLTHLRVCAVPDGLHQSSAYVVLAHHRSSPLPPDPQLLEYAWFTVEKMAAVLTMTLAWRRQAVELRRAATTDALTGLTNRAGFWPAYRILTARRGEPVAVLSIDLDDFKSVNDTMGHAVGDALLDAVGDRLLGAVRPSDLVSRFGGDEFVVVVCDLPTDDVVRIAGRIVESLGEPFALPDHEVAIGASVGIAVSTGGAVDAEALLERADRALYRAKHAGRSRWVLHDDDAADPLD
jgi:diguanylate cyclase (GGDEF)-like protein/PAS domain S-box-containing protein